MDTEGKKQERGTPTPHGVSQKENDFYNPWSLSLLSFLFSLLLAHCLAQRL